MKISTYIFLSLFFLLPVKTINAEATPRSLDIIVYMHLIIDSFDESKEKITEALALIDSEASSDNSLALQLLALRRYLRLSNKIGDEKIAANWSWKNSEIPGKEKEEPAKTLYAEARKAQAAFSTANPGYQIVVTPIRSLERQVKLWNENEKGLAASKRLLEDMVKELNKNKYKDKTDAEIAVMFGPKLQWAEVDPEPTNAVPGTSGHGRGIAVDFVVKKGNKVVAAIKTKYKKDGKLHSYTKDKWDGAGWTEKLKQACSVTRLEGPLKNPYEPWHWVLSF